MEITRDDINHVYYVNGRRLDSSVTKFTGNFFDDFDSALILNRCSKKKEYSHINEKIRKMYISCEWEQKRVIGSVLHKKIENFYNQKDDDEDIYKFDFVKDPLLSYFSKDKFIKIIEIKYANFITMHKYLLSNYKVCANEYMIFGHIHGIEIGGTINMLFWSNQAKMEVIIVDWKSNDNIYNYQTTVQKETSLFVGEKCDNIKKYSCQLHSYKFILEKYYHFKVVALLIINVCDNSSIIKINDHCKCFDIL